MQRLHRGTMRALRAVVGSCPFCCQMHVVVHSSRMYICDGVEEKKRLEEAEESSSDSDSDSDSSATSDSDGSGSSSD